MSPLSLTVSEMTKQLCQNVPCCFIVEHSVVGFH
jgi:hypothetical protein